MDIIKLIVVDDHTILREALVNTLSEEKDIKISGHWTNGEEAIDFLKSEKFHVAILDYKLPGISGIETARELSKINPAVKSIILTMYADEREILKAFNNGVVGYLAKECSINELVSAIRSVYYGSVVVSANMINNIVKSHTGFYRAVPYQNPLTVEETKILKLASNGYVNKEIAEKMGLSLGLVKFRIREILMKLEARDRTHAVIKAFKKGLLDADLNSLEEDI
jgi:DNA-binding NarL/FixJ family response regulator